MFSRPHSSPFTRVFAWVAVTAAALFGTAFALSSPALAQDDAPPDTTTEPGDTATDIPTDEPTEPEPTTDPDEADPSKKSQEDTEESDDVTAQVEPDFGYNKFRVGVELEDPSEADGLTTLGSKIRITEEFDDEPDSVTTCTTTLEDPVEPTTTYCEDLAPDFVGEELSDFYISSFTGGSRITVRQIGVNDGLVIIDGTKIVEPCGDCEDDRGDVLLLDGIDDDDDDGDDDEDDDGDDDGDDDDEEEGELPDVGAPDATLLGLGAVLVAIGSRLITGGRGRTRRDGAVI